VTCNRGDVVVVPFPFTDSPDAKTRPALVLSNASFNRQTGHSLMAMITTKFSPYWDLWDTEFDWKAASMPTRSVIRMKLFTIDNRLIRRSLGRLSASDQLDVEQRVRLVFA
jgi:mRNA interferase MazF